MNKKNDRKILITCPKVGFIPHLGMHGPIPNPLRVDYSICLSMIISGVKVYEVDPITRNTVLLTLDNIDDTNKFAKKVTPVVNKVNLKSIETVEQPTIKPEIKKVEMTNLDNITQPDVDTEALKKAEEEKAAKEAEEKAAKEAAEKAEAERIEAEKEARREAARQQAENYRKDKHNRHNNHSNQSVTQTSNDEQTENK